MPIAKYFRQAKVATTRYNLWKTFLQSTVFWGVFLVLMPVTMLWLERMLSVPRLRVPGQLATGVVVFLVAGCLNIWSGVAMAVAGECTPLPTDCPRRLVITGPYRWVRNPMAIGGLGMGLAIGIAMGSPLTLLVVVLGGLIWNYGVRPVEETHLERLFGDSYRCYQRAVKCWWPRWRPYREG